MGNSIESISSLHGEGILIGVPACTDHYQCIHLPMYTPDLILVLYHLSLSTLSLSLSLSLSTLSLSTLTLHTHLKLRSHDMHLCTPPCYGGISCYMSMSCCFWRQMRANKQHDIMSCCNTACEMRIPLFWSFCLCKFLSDVGESNDRYSGKLH